MCKELGRIGFFGRKNRLFELLQVFLVIVISFYSAKLYGKDKWQEGKKFTELFSPNDSLIYKVNNESEKVNYYLFKGKKYYSFYPLLNMIKESDPAIPNSLISAYKTNRNVSFVFSVIATISYGVFLGSVFWGWNMLAMTGVINSSIERWFSYSCLSLIGSVWVGMIYEGRKDKLENEIRDHYNGYISGFNKNIGLELKYEF